MRLEENKRYPAKVLLFGEHVVLRGAQALAIPLDSRGCYWAEGGTTEQQGGLGKLTTFLAQHHQEEFNIADLQADLTAGAYLASDVPVGYGLGSSAGVCVAVFDRYATAAGQRQLERLGPQAYLAQLEHCFHGASSGIDPLIIYQQAPIHVNSEGETAIVDLPPLPEGWRMFLFDTGQARSTAPLVKYVMGRYDNEPVFQAAVDEQWLKPTNTAINALVNADFEQLWAAWRTISQFQSIAVPPLHVAHLHPLWAQGLTTEQFLLKFCGAGGGGYCLGITKNWDNCQALLKAQGRIVVI